jgi:hypothetical protein
VKLLTTTVVMPLLLAACGPLLNFTLERAAVQEALNFSEPNLPVDPDSIQVLQTQEQGEITLVVVSLQRGRETAMPDKCLAMYEVRRTALGWMTVSGGTGCGPIGGNRSALDVSSGGAHQSNESASSHVTGLVREPLITFVEVTWADGEVQQVPVVNGSYLAWREGVSNPVKILGLDAEDQVIYTWETSVPAPGKEMP